MTRDDDLYARHQLLAALVNVLVHDLRNPLHSATLLIEAMGSPSADTGALRTKLRAQIGKLDGIIAETNAGMKELALEPGIEAVDVDTFLRTLSEYYPTVSDFPATFVLPPASGLEVATDRRLLERAAAEVAAVLAEQNGAGDGAGPTKVMVKIDEPEAGAVCIRFGELSPGFSEALAKAPFAIAGGGIRLAVARALAQNAGATMRLEHDADGSARFTLLLRKPEQRETSERGL